MKHSLFAFVTIGAAFAVVGCQSLGTLEKDSPTLIADNNAVVAANVVVLGDLAQINADRTANPLAIPVDTAKWIGDQVPLRNAWVKLVADLKAAGQPAPPAPSGLTANSPA